MVSDQRLHPPGGWLRLLAGLLLSLAILPMEASAQRDGRLVFGVFAERPPAVVQARFEPLVEYLEDSIPGVRFELRVLSPDSLDRSLQRNEIDLLLTTPTHYQVVRSENALSGVLATLMTTYRGETTMSFGGVIFTRADTGLRNLHDLTGLTIASPGERFLGGYQAPLREAIEAGVDLRRSNSFVFLPDHDAVVEAVLESRADVGFVRTGVIEDLIDQKRVDPEALRVIHRQRIGAFPYRVSTRLYPEWPLVTMPHIGPLMERRIAAALFSLETGDPVARQTDIAGFGPPSDYLSVERLTRSLGLPPFEAEGEVTWREIWVQYRLEASILAVASFIVSLLALALLMRHLALRRSEERFRRFFEDNASVLLLVDTRLGVVLDANEAAVRFYGWPREALVERPLSDIWDEEDWRGKGDREFGRNIHTARLRNGTTRFVEAHATPMESRGDGERMFVIVHDVTERVRAEEALAEQRRRLANVIEGTNVGIWEWNIQTGRILVNERWAEMVGYRLAELEPTTIETWEGFAHPADMEKANRLLKACFRGDADYYDAEVRMRHRDGHWIWVLDRGRVLEWTDDGEPLRMWGTHQDITARKRMEQDLQLAASVFVHAREGIMITDLQGHIVDVNAAFSEMTGWSREEVLGKTPAFLRSGRQDDAFYRRLWERLGRKGFWSGELWNRRKDGGLFAERITISRVTNADGEPTNYIALASDITDLKTYQKELEHQASHDALTGLPNRVLMADRLKLAMAETRRKGGLLAVAFLDLDGFKGVNDRYGHEMGDKLLIEVSRDFDAQLREVDTLARISGDEFVIVLGTLENEAAAVPIIDRLVEAAGRRRVIDGKDVQVTASAGYTFYPQDEPVDDEDLLKQADTAMYTAKEGGRNRACRYRPDDD